MRPACTGGRSLPPHRLWAGRWGPGEQEVRDTRAPTPGPATASHRTAGSCATLRQAGGKFPVALTETPILTHQSENVSYRRASTDKQEQRTAERKLSGHLVSSSVGSVHVTHRLLPSSKNFLLVFAPNKSPHTSGIICWAMRSSRLSSVLDTLILRSPL